MIIKSEEMAGAIDITHQHQTLIEKALLASLPKFTASEFSMICNIVKDDCNSLDKFLKAGEEQV